MSIRKIRKGDKVIALAGKDKGSTGIVLRMLDNGKVVVEGLNLITKHQKPNPNLNIEGGLVKREAPMDASNVALVNPASGKADRVGVKYLNDGKKVRYFKSNGEVVDI